MKDAATNSQCHEEITRENKIKSTGRTGMITGFYWKEKMIENEKERKETETLERKQKTERRNERMSIRQNGEKKKANAKMEGT